MYYGCMTPALDNKPPGSSNGLCTSSHHARPTIPDHPPDRGARLSSLAFVRGPENHYYAQERYNAYLDVLREQGTPFDAALVTRPVDWKAGAKAAQMLLDEQKLRPRIDFDAVVAASDRLAYGALQTLQARWLPYPQWIGLCQQELRFAMPGLGTR